MTLAELGIIVFFALMILIFLWLVHLSNRGRGRPTQNNDTDALDGMSNEESEEEEDSAVWL